jgi:hypothetical protein
MPRPFSIPPAIGAIYTYLTVVSGSYTKIINGRKYSFIKVWCKCGKSFDVKMTSIMNGRKKSCGCLPRELASERMATRGGLSKTKEYRAWLGMLKRCYDPRYKLYHRYGGRGISVCLKWRFDFVSFLNDVGKCPIDKTSLDRFPNNDGNYEPGNIRWANDKEQANNRSTCQMFKIGNEIKNLTQWCLEYNMPYKVVHSRIFRQQLDLLTALTKPISDTKYKSKNDSKSRAL